MGCDHSLAAEMRRFVAFGKAFGIALPMALALFGVGCVNLDKPADVQACAATNTCFNGERKDAAVNKDSGGGDSGSTTIDGGAEGDATTVDTKPGADSVTVYDTGTADRADSGRTDAADAGTDRPALIDGAQPDEREDDDVAPDAPLADAADAPVKDVPGPDTADVAQPDTNTTPIDGGPANVVTFSSGRGVGLMTGYGWVGLGTGDTVTSPTCGSTGTQITSTSPCASGTNWGTANPTALCVSGSIPSTGTATVASGNWGIQVGVNAKDPNAGIGQSFKTITVNASAVPTGEIRVELHRSADASGDTYCAKWTSSTTAMTLTTFNKKCWDNTGVYLTAADVPLIDQVGLQVASGNAAITLSNMCLQSITFGN